MMKSLVSRFKAFALLAVVAAYGGAWADAPTPVAVWDGDFTVTQTGYTLNRNGNSLSEDKTTITIDQSIGVAVDFSTAMSSGMTVLFKYSNLNLSLGSAQTLASSATVASDNTSSSDRCRTGVYIDDTGNTCGLWVGSKCDYVSSVGKSSSQQTLASDHTSGVMAFTYYQAEADSTTKGTHLFYLKNGVRSNLYDFGSLGAGGEASYYGCSIGGSRYTTTNGGPATGMKITGIAVFSGVLTEDQMTSYVWPRYKSWDYVAAGRVLTWKSSPDSSLDNGTGQKITVAGTTYSVFNIKDATDGEPYYGGATASSGAYWHYFAFQQAKYSSPGSAMRFIASDTYAKNIRADYSPLTLGGLIVDKGATGYSIAEDASNTGSRRDNRATVLGSQPASESETWFRFCEDFTFGRQGALAFVGKVNLEIESGKTVTVQSKQNNSSETFIPKVCSAVAINNDGSGALATLTGGGTLRLHGAGNLSAPGLDASSATLDFSDIGSRYNDDTPFINCPLTVNANTTFILPDGITLPYTYKVATSISAGEADPNATWTDANGNVFTHAATVDEENGTIAVNLANATTITVNGALTLNGATAADITVNADKTLTLDSGAVLSGTVTGDGSIAISNSVNLSEAVSVTVANLYLTGSSLTFGTGVDLEVTTMLRTTHAGASDCSITQTSGSLTCSGPANDSSYKLGAFVLSHWGAITTYTLSGGSLTVNNSTAKFGADGTGNMTISGTGVANFHSLSLRRGTLTVDAGGTLNLGATGQTSPVSRNEGNLTLDGGTMGAWNSSTITIPVPVTVSGNSTIRATTVSGAAATVIFTGAITGSGNLTIAGGGKVVFAGDMSGYTGSFAVSTGTLDVPSGVSVTSVAAGAKVVVKTSTSPASLEAAISGGYSLFGSLSIPESVDGTLTFVDSSGHAVADADSAWENDVRTFTGTAPVNGTYTGNQWVWDYEFNGSYASIGSDTTGVNPEGSGTQFTAADASGNQELYFQKTPYRGASFSTYTEMTAVMYCAPGDYADKVLVGFGSTTASGQKAISLVTGANPASGEMKLVLTDGQAANAEDKVKVLANLTAVDATTKKHLYAFVMDRIEENSVTKTRVRVYMDGKVKAIYKHNGTLALSDGFQIGSIHGGVAPSGFNTGLTKYPASGDSGTLDFLRVKNAALSDGAMAILANTYPYESAHGEATRDPVSAGLANTWVSTDAWTQTVPSEDDATQNAPNADTNVKLSIDGSSAVSVALNLEDDSNYESVTFSKEAGATGSLKVTSGFGNATSGKLIAAETAVLVDTTVPAGRVKLGNTSVADGVTLTIDPYSTVGNTTIVTELEKLSFGETYEDEIISMAILGDGASVKLDSGGVSRLAMVGFTATLYYDDTNQSYTFRVTRVEASSATNISVTVGTSGVATWVLNGVVLPTPATIPADYANTVTIDASAYDGTAEIATAFAGGNVTVASGSVSFTGDITTSGTVALNSATTLSGNTVSSALTGSGTVTIDGTVTLNGSIANTINGSGTLALSAIPKTLSFGTWTGTVELPELAGIAGDTFSFNSYGVEGSTVRINGIGGGWLRDEEVNPTIDIPATKTLTISDFSASFNNTFKALSGAGTFAVTYNTAIDTTAGVWYSSYSAYYLIKNVSGFTGSLSTGTPGIAIGASKPVYQTAGGKILLTSADAVLTVSTVPSPVPTSGVDGYSVWTYTSVGNTVYSLANAETSTMESYTDGDDSFEVPVGWMVAKGLSSASGLGTDAANGLTFFECYALGLDPADSTDEPVAIVTVNGDGNFVVVLKHADGTSITPAGNVSITYSLLYGDSADAATTPQADTTFAPPDATVRYYKVQAAIAPAS